MSGCIQIYSFRPVPTSLPVKKCFIIVWLRRGTPWQPAWLYIPGLAPQVLSAPTTYPFFLVVWSQQRPQTTTNITTVTKRRTHTDILHIMKRTSKITNSTSMRLLFGLMNMIFLATLITCVLGVPTNPPVERQGRYPPSPTFFAITATFRSGAFLIKIRSNVSYRTNHRE